MIKFLESSLGDEHRYLTFLKHIAGLTYSFLQLLLLYRNLIKFLILTQANQLNSQALHLQ